MYLPDELARIVIIGFVIYAIYKVYNIIHPKIEDIEAYVESHKKRWFDSSSHLVSYLANSELEDFKIMERHYFRLKQRFSSDYKKKLEIAKDWQKYTNTISDIESANVVLDVDDSNNAYENYDENTREAFIVKDEIEKKFKSLLGNDWEELYSEKLKRAFQEKARKEKQKKNKK